MKEETKAFVLGTLKLKANMLAEQLQKLTLEHKATVAAIDDLENDGKGTP